MEKGKKLEVNDLINVADGNTNIIVVSQTGYERMCILTKESLKDAKYDVKNHYCEMYLSK